MSVPAVGNVLTPAGFTATSAQSQVLLTWYQVPLSTIYYVNRSADNVTFTNIGQTANLQYSDLTATVGVVYYYNIQAGNGTSSSLPTQSLSALALRPGQTTVANLRLECQQRCDKVNSQFYTNQEWNSMISQSYKELYDILIQKFGNDYFIAPPVSYLTTGTLDSTYGAQVFALPNDFYKLMRVEVALNPSDPNSWITLRKFEAIQANLWNYPNVYTFYGITNLRYRLWGSNLQLVPLSAAGQTIRIWYSPKPNQLIADTDTVDAVSGWEEYIVTDACEKAMIKEESFESAQAFSSQKAMLMQRIIEASENRDVGSPETVSDSRLRNFAWSDGGDGYGGGAW